MIVKGFQYCAKIFIENNKTAFNFSIKCGLKIDNYSACQALMPLCTFSVVD